MQGNLDIAVNLSLSAPYRMREALRRVAYEQHQFVSAVCGRFLRDALLRRDSTAASEGDGHRVGNN